MNNTPQWIKAQVERKICSTCKESQEKSEFYPHKRSKDRLFYECKKCCKTRHHEGWQKAYWADPERYRKRSQDWIKANPDKYRDGYIKAGKLYRDKTRDEALERYGGKCMCCGEKQKEFLCFDHINGGGGKHRKEVGSKIVVWLKKNNYPDTFQVLCHNCNMSKGFYGYCPHKI